MSPVNRPHRTLFLVTLVWCLPVAVAARERGREDTTSRTALVTPSGQGFNDFLSLLARHSTNNFILLLGFYLVWSPSLSIFMVDVDMWIFAVSSTLMSPFLESR